MVDQAKAKSTRARNRAVMRDIENTPSRELQVTPKQQLALRQQAFETVMTRMSHAKEVLDGHREWSAHQTRLFGMLLNKVMPDLKYSKTESEHTVKSTHELSREELEKLVSEGTTYDHD